MKSCKIFMLSKEQGYNRFLMNGLKIAYFPENEGMFHHYLQEFHKHRKMIGESLGGVSSLCHQYFELSQIYFDSVD